MFHSSQSLLFFFLIVFQLVTTNAAQITQVKNDKVLIQLGPAEILQPGNTVKAEGVDDEFANIEILQVKNARAIGKVTGGQAIAGMKINAPKTNMYGVREREKKPLSKLSMGALLGYAMNTQNVKLTSESIAMKGTGFNLKGTIQVPLYSAFDLIGRIGYEQFSVTGTSTSVGSTSTKIGYTTFDMLLAAKFLTGSWKPYGFGGLGIYLPISKESQVLNINDLNATTIFLGGLGMEFMIERNLSINAIVEYGYFPPSTDVSTNFLALRVGGNYYF